MKMRVEVLTPWTHDLEPHEVGSFVEVDEDLVRALKGTLGQDHVPAPASGGETDAGRLVPPHGSGPDNV
jgi:hypothetical protein